MLRKIDFRVVIFLLVPWMPNFHTTFLQHFHKATQLLSYFSPPSAVHCSAEGLDIRNIEV